jgi:hypothetical protein
MEFFPVIRGIIEDLFESNDDDVVVTKRALDRLGYHRSTGPRPTCFADKDFFDGLRKFQKDRGLKVDGTILPGGETSQALGALLSEKTPEVSLPEPGAVPTPEQCDDLYYNIDIPTCRGIARQRGKKAAARCYATAAERYAKCLQGKPLEDLPPLNVWNN